MTPNSQPYRWTEADLREVEANYREQRSGQWMYAALAARDRRGPRAALLQQLAAFEERHAGLWAGLLTRLGRPITRPPRLWNHRILVRMARIFGVAAVLPIIHRMEVDGIEKYQDQARRWRDPVAEELFRTVLPDEVAYEIETSNAARQQGASTSGSLRSVLLGAIDGFASVVALSAGVAGATNSSRTVLIAGTAAVVAGALSMAASEYVSVKAEREARTAQHRMEREAMLAAPETKQRQLAAAYEAKGLTAGEAEKVVERLGHDPERFLQSLLVDRYGTSDEAEPPPTRQGVLTGISFALAGVVPLLPFLFLGAHAGVVASVLLTAGALFLAGLLRALSSLQPFLRSGLEMLAIGMGAAAGTFLIGLAIGGAVG